MENFNPGPKEDVMIFGSIFLALLAVSLSVFSLPLGNAFLKRSKTVRLLPIAPPQTTFCKKGVNTFSIGESCENGRYKYADFSCYDNSKGKFTGVNCRSSAEFYQAAELACNKLSDQFCYQPTISPVPNVLPTPTNISQCQTEGNDCPVPFDCCQGLSCQIPPDSSVGKCTALPTPMLSSCKTGIFKSICGFKGYTWCPLGTVNCDSGWIDEPKIEVSCPANTLFTTSGEFCSQPDGQVKFKGSVGKCQVNNSCSASLSR